MQDPSETDFSAAIERSMRIRKIYHQLEELKHGSHWSRQEDFIGFANDVGELGRMVMASEGRWLYKEDLGKDLPDKLAECLWWIFVLSDRMGVNLSSAFAAKMNELESDLTTSLEGADDPR
jgi:NTP pyrophosphatase (non-canonical NTP hydrolase)